MNILLSVFSMDSLHASYYLGTSNLNLFWSSMFFGYVGVLIMILMELAGRDPKKAGSPFHFSWSYFLSDNVFRFILNTLIVAVCIRFMPQFINQPVAPWHALLIGFGSDYLAAKIKKQKDSFLGTDTITTTDTSIVSATSTDAGAQQSIAAAVVNQITTTTPSSEVPQTNTAEATTAPAEEATPEAQTEQPA